MIIPMLIRQHLYIESAPRWPFLGSLWLWKVSATCLKIWYRCSIFKGVIGTWQEWEGTSIVSPAMTTRCDMPYWNVLMQARWHKCIVFANEITSRKIFQYFHFSNQRPRLALIMAWLWIGSLVRHYRDIINIWSHLISLAIWLFAQRLNHANKTNTIRVLHHWPFVRGNHQSLVDSPHKGSVMWKAFPSHDTIAFVVREGLVSS